jgi:hypothetical protein
MNDLAVLFVRRDSPYARFAVDLWCEERDARRYEGPWPVVAHPPCRGWGRLRHLAKVAPHELELALWAVHCVRSFGGVLEHPAGSTLWGAAGLPPPGGTRDDFGGWSMSVDQGRFGHGAPKSTWLYVCGTEPELVPPLPPRRDAGRLVENMCRVEREATPPALCHWLLTLALRCCV